MLFINYKGNIPQQRFYSIGVQGDNKANIVKFCIEKLQGTLDLSFFTPYLKVMNKEGGYADKIELSFSSEESETFITLEWEMTRKSTHYRNLELQLQFENHDEDIVFQTLIIELELNGTLDIDKEISEEYPTVLEQVEKKVEDMEEQVEQNTEDIADIKAKGDTIVIDNPDNFLNDEGLKKIVRPMDTNGSVNKSYMIDKDFHPSTLVVCEQHREENDYEYEDVNDLVDDLGGLEFELIFGEEYSITDETNNLYSIYYNQNGVITKGIRFGDEYSNYGALETIHCPPNKLITLVVGKYFEYDEHGNKVFDEHSAIYSNNFIDIVDYGTKSITEEKQEFVLRVDNEGAIYFDSDGNDLGLGDTRFILYEIRAGEPEHTTYEPKELLKATTEANKVYGTDENGNQTTYGKDEFGQVEDVKVNNVSVVEDKVANIDLTPYAKLIGELPHIVVKASDDIATFIQNNDVVGKAIVVNFTGNSLAGKYIGCISRYSATLYMFYFINLFETPSYFSYALHITNKTFDDVFTLANIRYFETTGNKVSVIDENSTYEQYASAKSVWKLVQAIKRNAFTPVNTTTYPTLADFLASTGEEGYLYLYPVDTSDLTKGYKQYIWESDTWVYMGDTQLDLTNYPRKDQNETITGEWTFGGTTTFNGVIKSGSVGTVNNGIELSGIYATSKIYQNNSNELCFKMYNNKEYRLYSGGFYCSTDDNANLGTSSYHWKEGFINKITDTKGSYDSNNTINSINASDIASGGVLTQEQYDLITNGKQTQIKGTLNGVDDPLIIATATFGSSTRCLITSKSSANIGFGYFDINISTRIINQRSNYIRFKTNGIQIGVDNGGSMNIDLVGKALPNYPSNTGTFVNKMINGTWSWAEEIVMTQADYDSLATKDPNTTYYIEE